ncbi:glycosyltransferase family 2 protein [Bdellovibrio sp. HCB209]|uniref:glycosyltransferase family 2 protein n=1 Tax=Bdellovibrio sp. HCB209 TaxID=3394354 RepID=UPI0039B4AC5F
MSIIITMAGNSTRFRKAGYNIPKYQIVTKGHTIFEWSMRSLAKLPRDMKIIFVVKKEDEAFDFIKSECRKLGFETIEVIELDGITNGQATTAKLAISQCKENEFLGIYNIDTYVKAENVFIPNADMDGLIPCFNPPGSHWSFVRADKDGVALEVVEKKKISDNATVGFYWFKNPKVYLEAYEVTFSNQDQFVNGEAYIAPMYNSMIGKGLKVGLTIVPNDDVFALGTPEELKQFEANNLSNF